MIDFGGGEVGLRLREKMSNVKRKEVLGTRGRLSQTMGVMLKDSICPKLQRLSEERQAIHTSAGYYLSRYAVLWTEGLWIKPERRNRQRLNIDMP